MAKLKMSASVPQPVTKELQEQKTAKKKITEYIPGTDISQEELAGFKAEYKKIFQSIYTGKTYIWHRLNRRIFGAVCEKVKGIEDPKQLIALREKEIVKACVLYPRAEEMQQLAENPMVVSRIGQEILQRSGFAPLSKD